MKVELKKPYIEAMEVTPNFIHSLPNAGAIMQKFGSEQVEILMPSPHQKKQFATLGEFILRFEDENGKENYAIVSAMAFKSVFTEYTGPDLEEEATEEEPIELDTPVAPEEEPTKVDRRRKRTKELLEQDVDGMEVPLAADAIDVGE